MNRYPDYALLSGQARERAVEHILNVLDYENFFCLCIKTRVNFQTGKIFSVLPPGVEAEQINDCSQGYGKGSDRSLPNRIVQALELHPGSVAIFDDVMADPGDKLTKDFVISDVGEIYRFAALDDGTVGNITALVAETAVAWHFLCAIVSIDKDIDIKDCFRQSHCDSLVNIWEIVVGAFDGEGYIHWVE